MVELTLFCIRGLVALHVLEKHIFGFKLYLSNRLTGKESKWVSNVETVSLDLYTVKFHGVCLEIHQQLCILWTFFVLFAQRVAVLEFIELLVIELNSAVEVHDIWEKVEQLSNVGEGIKLKFPRLLFIIFMLILAVFINLNHLAYCDLKIFAALLLF